MDINTLVDLMIARLPGLKGCERIALQRKFDKAADLSILSKKDVEVLVGRALKGAPWTMEEVLADAERDAVAAQKGGIRWVSLRQEEYPPLLREMPDPPVVLFYRGVLPNPEKPLVAVVGTRKPSAVAAQRAFKLAKELGESGLSVVSGLALGIDAMAHRGNIEGKAATIAVLGSAPDCVYPATNRGIARRILETGGAILSEYPPGTMPAKWRFPARNRIVSGLARGVVIVEAPVKSGALITAQFALDQCRDVWVDSAGVSSPCGAGTARLVEDGCRVIDSSLDILSEWNIGGNGIHHHARISSVGNVPFDKGAGLASSLAEYLDITL